MAHMRDLQSVLLPKVKGSNMIPAGLVNLHTVGSIG